MIADDIADTADTSDTADTADTTEAAAREISMAGECQYGRGVSVWQGSVSGGGWIGEWR